MVYDHMVKANGQYYDAGEDVPEVEDAVGSEGSPPFFDENVTPETRGNAPCTKSDIQRMNKAELLEMAKSAGVENAGEMTRAELAEYMLSIYGL